jgi:hypothetical protein
MVCNATFNTISAIQCVMVYFIKIRKGAKEHKNISTFTITDIRGLYVKFVDYLNKI